MNAIFVTKLICKILFLSLVLTLVSCQRDVPRLVRATSARTFFFDNFKRENFLFQTDDHTVFPLCVDSSSFPVLCSSLTDRPLYLDPKSIGELDRLPQIPRWTLRFLENDGSEVTLKFEAPPGNIVDAELHPLAWLDTTDSPGPTLHLSPVIPGVTFSAEFPKSITYPAISWRAIGEHETVVRIPQTKALAYQLNWENPLLLKIKAVTKFDTKRTLVLDPGHGGDESGACVLGVCEKDLSLKVALKLKEALSHENLNVILTRESDLSISLYDRVRFAEKHRADLFISLHFDNWGEGPGLPRPNGMTCYYFQAGSRKIAQGICDGDPNSILRTNSWLAQRSLYVLHSSLFPSVLLEVANLNDDLERSSLQDPAVLDQIVQSLAAKILSTISMHST